MTIKLLIYLLVCCTWCLPASAYYADYLPGPILKERKTLPQKIVARDFGHDWSAQVSGITLKNVEGQFTISGVGKDGSPWASTESEDRGFGGSCYSADVDKNGFEDVIVHFPNASNGYPFSSVVIFFVDQDGMVHREEIVSRFSADKTGIADIIETSGGPVVLVQDLAYGRQGKRDLGYWRFTAFKPQQCRLINMTSVCNMPLPAYVFFTLKPNHLTSTRAALLERHYKESKK